MMHQRRPQKEGRRGGKKKKWGGPWGNVGAGVVVGMGDCSFRSRNSAMGLIVIFTHPVCSLPPPSVLVEPNKMVESNPTVSLSQNFSKGRCGKGKGEKKIKRK
jgi:hypothetical protein